MVNSLAERFYREHGVTRIEPGYDLRRDFRDLSVMRMRYCLRREMGTCLKEHPAYKGKLYLRHEQHLFELQFACAGDWSVTPEKISGVGTVSLVRSGLVVIGRENYEVPELKLDLKHAFSIEPARKLADLRAFQLTLTEDGRPVVDCALQQPAEISYAPEGRHFPGAAPQLRLTVDQFNLAPVRKFLPPALPVKLNGGVLNGNLLATVEPDSEEIQLSGLTQLSNLELELPQCLYQNLNLTAAYAARVALGKTAELAKLTVTLKEKDQTLLQVVAGGDYHFADRSGSAAVKITDATLQLIPLLPLPEDQCAKLNSYARILDPLSLQLSLGADFDLTGKSFQLTALDLQGLQQQELLMRLTASPFGGTFQPFQLAEPVKAKFLLQNFALTRLQSLLPAEQLRIFRGTLSTSGEVDAAADLKSFRIAGESRQDNLDLIAAGQRLAMLGSRILMYNLGRPSPYLMRRGKVEIELVNRAPGTAVLRALDVNGKTLADVPFTEKAGKIVFAADPGVTGAFAYELLRR